MALIGCCCYRIIPHNALTTSSAYIPSIIITGPLNSKLKIRFHSNLKTPLFNFSSNFRHNEDSLSAVQLPVNPTTATVWSEFARNVSGEWDGFGAEFSTDGKPKELPESVVPEAYREWDVKVYDWQTQCPTLALAEVYVLTFKTIKLLPTVGCEADAATRYSIDERSVGGLDNKASAFAYQSSGCYVAVWPQRMDAASRKVELELEHCLMSPKDREGRVRIIQVVGVVDSKVKLEYVRVFREQWYGPFRNGEQLGGCAIRDSAFASTPPLDASSVIGVWQGHSSVANFHAPQSEFMQELINIETERKSVRDENELVLLPKQLWCSVKESKDGEALCEVGWLVDQGTAITSQCVISTADAKLKEISISHETASLA